MCRSNDFSTWRLTGRQTLHSALALSCATGTNHVSQHGERVRIGSLRSRGIVDDQQGASSCIRPELKPLRVIHMQPIGQFSNSLDAVRSDDAGAVVMCRVPPPQDKRRSLERHGRPHQQKKVVSLKPHIADPQTTGIKQVLAVAPLAIDPSCLQPVWGFLPQFQIENHGMAPQHWPPQPKPDPASANGQAFDVEAVLLGRDVQKRCEVRVCGKPALKGALPLAQLEPACLRSLSDRAGVKSPTASSTRGMQPRK